MSSTEDPAVIAWRLVMAPQPRFRVGRHWWRQIVTECWRAAYDQWLKDLEHHSTGYDTEAAEWKAENPAPRLSDFMRQMSRGRWAPEAVTPKLALANAHGDIPGRCGDPTCDEAHP